MKTLNDYTIHPLADKLPMMNELEFEELKKQIKLHGLLNPIIIDHQNRIIDGRNRLKACTETETEPRFITLSRFLQDYEMYLGEHFPDIENQTGNLNKAIEAGDEEKIIEHLIILLNVNRRHLTNFEKFMRITENKPTLSAGRPKKQNSAPSAQLISDEKPALTVDVIAKELNVSPRSVKQMNYIKKNGSEELNNEVKAGKKSVKAAYNQLKAEEKAKQPQKPLPKPKSTFVAYVDDEERNELFKMYLKFFRKVENEFGLIYLSTITDWVMRGINHTNYKELGKSKEIKG